MTEVAARNRRKTLLWHIKYWGEEIAMAREEGYGYMKKDIPVFEEKLEEAKRELKELYQEHGEHFI